MIPQKNERIEGKLGIVIDTIKESGIIFLLNLWFVLVKQVAYSEFRSNYNMTITVATMKWSWRLKDSGANANHWKEL